MIHKKAHWPFYKADYRPSCYFLLPGIAAPSLTHFYHETVILLSHGLILQLMQYLERLLKVSPFAS